jgi:AmmeMemoRadiSam system protein A
MSTRPPILTQAQRTALLAIARSAIQERVLGNRTTQVPCDDPVLQVPGAAFVTITRRGGELRGCIGYIEAVRPLAEAVAHCAASAATADPRFSPVVADELPILRVEVSILSALQPIAHPEDIQVGTHGILVRQGGRQGLLLPQVAIEFGWDRETFLRHTCLKGALPEDAWKHGAMIQVFTVEHFTDDTPLDLPGPRQP